MKTSFKSLFLFGLSFIVMFSCSGAKVYNSTDVTSVTASQQKIAILPPTVSMLEGKYTGHFEQTKETESANFQKAMYTWFLKRFSQNKATQEILDLETTNIKLKRAGYPVKELTKDEICEILGVDAVISSDYILSKPMPQSVAIAASVLLDYKGTTNKIVGNINIYDKKTQKVFWNYGNDYSGGWESTHTDIVENLMRNASKNLPYGNKK